MLFLLAILSGHSYTEVHTFTRPYTPSNCCLTEINWQQGMEQWDCVFFETIHNFLNLSLSSSRVFGTDIQGRDCGDEAARWLNRYLGGEIGYRLVHFEPHMEPRRSADQEKLFSQDEVNISVPQTTRLCCLSTLNYKLIFAWYAEVNGGHK